MAIMDLYTVATGMEAEETFPALWVTQEKAPKTSRMSPPRVIVKLSHPAVSTETLEEFFEECRKDLVEEYGTPEEWEEVLNPW